MYVLSFHLSTLLFSGGSEVVCTVIRIWYSLRLSENDFSLLVSTLEDLLAAGDVGSLTSGFMNAGTPEQLKELKSVWNTWANLSTLEGHWVTDRRKAALQKDEGTAESAQNYLNSIPQNHRDSAKMWIEDGLFATSQCNPSSLTKENITLTGSSFACKNFKTSEYDYCIPAKDVPFTGWDYKAIIDIEDSLPEMYNTYLSHILNKCIDKLRSCQVKLTVILSDCMAIDPFLPVELKYDRITTSNLSDYISLTTLLTKFKEYLNTKNSHSVLVTEVQNWSRYLPDVKNEMFQKYFELASKVLNDTNNPCLTLTNYSSLVEYHNLIPHFELYLRASLIESQSEEELDSLLRKKKVASIKAITTGLGLKLSDFVRNENTVFPARWAVNCRRVTKISGDEFALEWKLPPLP